ncbi:MAG TPA: SH3 domain-containing protein [Candidatus Angelobacter sp.]|nr:SH3 domain-containing protein [Candidatus Angelobacter sp.]
MRDSPQPTPANSIGCFPRPTFLAASSRPILAGLLILIAAGLASCGGGPSGKAEYVYVAVPEASLRDHVATIYNKTGAVHNGERLQVLDRMQNKRFVRVRSPRGETGWLQERYLADQQTYEQFRRMGEQYRDAPGQSTATVEAQVRVHVQPGRKAGSLYLLDEKQKVMLLARQPVNRNAASVPPKDPDAEGENSEEEKANEGPPAIWEDWWLVRDQQQRVGWVLGRSLYLEVPEDVAQYAEGQRIVAAYPLDQVEDDGQKVSEYLVLFTEPKDGLPYDFDQFRVYTRNTRKHRYETAYRERNLTGSLPVTLGQQDFGKEGVLRTFTFHVKDEDGQIKERLYKFRPPLVHRVLDPGEQPPPVRRKPAHRRRR